jgi:hypothetical protein
MKKKELKAMIVVLEDRCHALEKKIKKLENLLCSLPGMVVPSKVDTVSELKAKILYDKREV